MKNVKVVGHKQRLDDIFKKSAQLNHEPELIAHWSRYLCVLVSGFVEASVRTLVLDYAAAQSSPDVARFVGQRLRDFQNAKMQKILDLAQDFSDRHAETLARKTDGKLKDAVDSVVSNRHQIAHGQDVGIAFATIKGYYDSVVEVIELIENQFKV